MATPPEPISLGSPRFRTVELEGIRISDVWFPPGATLPRHTHERAVFAVGLEGSIDSRMQARTLECETSSVWTEPAGESHENRVGEGGARVLALLPDADDPLLGPCAPLLDDIHHLRHAGVADIGRRLLGEMEADDEPSRLTLHGLALEALAMGLRARKRERDRGTLPGWLDEARALVHDRFREGLRISEIADEVDVDATTLARCFRRHFGVPLGGYQRRLRLDWAADQLRTTDRPLSMIAVGAGFYDQSHLTRHFRRYAGRPPGAYRAAHRD